MGRGAVAARAEIGAINQTTDQATTNPPQVWEHLSAGTYERLPNELRVVSYLPLSHVAAQEAHMHVHVHI